MGQEAEPGIWHMVSENGTPPAVVNRENHLIATLSATSEKTMLARAALLATSPELYAAGVALSVFRLIAQHSRGKAALAARDMIPMLESVLGGATFLGEITPEVLNGE